MIDAITPLRMSSHKFEFLILFDNSTPQSRHPSQGSEDKFEGMQRSLQVPPLVERHDFQIFLKNIEVVE